MDAPTNLILTNGTGDRIVLKSPVVEPHSTEAQIRAQVQSVVSPAKALLINSPKDRCLTQLASDVAQAGGAVQYSVLSLSLPMADQISLLLARDTASVCNLAEFHQLAGALGYACPSDETSADLMAIAFVMAQVAHAHAAGDLVVTLGARGCLAADQAAGAIAYIGLRPVRAIEVQRFVRMDTERRNGTGDRYFGSFAAGSRLRRGLRLAAAGLGCCAAGLRGHGALSGSQVAARCQLVCHPAFAGVVLGSRVVSSLLLSTSPGHHPALRRATGCCFASRLPII